MELTTDQPQMFDNSIELVGSSMSKLAANKSIFFIYKKFIAKQECHQNKSELLNFMIVSVQMSLLLMKLLDSVKKEKLENLSIKETTHMAVKSL
jgi:hypothetical protein